MIYLIIVVVVLIGLIIWKIKQRRNSRNLPQMVEIPEYDNPMNRPEQKEYQKGYNLFLSREVVHTGGYHLFLTLNTNGKELSELRKIIISWSEWKSRMYSFKHLTSDNTVTINDDKIKIDLGSFNNCPGSKNFLKRTAYSNTISIDLLDYEPDINDFSYENNIETQSAFLSIYKRDELKKFRKGSHYLDS